MMHAYNELYLYDSQILLANAFHYALNDCKIDLSIFEGVLSSHRLIKLFERGDPSVISGRSSEELIRDIFSEVIPGKILPDAVFEMERSPEYWAGWALAYYQWYSAKNFEDIFKHIPLVDVLAMYRIYHEMDIMRFVEEMDRRYDLVILETKLKMIREARGLSQSELAILSGVNKRSIQLYEQRVNDIDKSQAHTLYKLARTLCCDIEDLLERPELIK